MNLNQTILNECREEVAKEQLHPDWESLISWTIENNTSVRDISVFIQAYSQIVGEKAMDRQAEFYEWASQESYIFCKCLDAQYWYLEGFRYDENWTTEQLYQIWKEGK